MKSNKCLNCKKEFIPNYRSTQKFCHNGCYQEYWKNENKQHLSNYKILWYLKHRQEVIKRSRDYSLENPLKFKKWNRDSFLNNKDKYLERNKEWRKKNPKKVKAQHLSQYNIKLKSSCEICGDNNRILQRHHWNYDKPLMVNTLCIPCHKVQHQRSSWGVSQNEI